MSDRGRSSWPITIIEFDRLNLEQKKAQIEENKYNYIKPQLENWIEFEEKVSDIKSYIKSPTILLSMSIVTYTIGIICANLIHCSSSLIECIVLLSSLAIEIMVISNVVNNILKAIE